MPASGRDTAPESAAPSKGGIVALYGVQVIDTELYRSYRENMTPILEDHGGRFVIDVAVAEVLRSPAEQPFNRLFTMRFPSVERLEAFFTNPEYLEVRRRFFERSVSSVASLGRYEVL